MEGVDEGGWPLSSFSNYALFLLCSECGIQLLLGDFTGFTGASPEFEPFIFDIFNVYGRCIERTELESLGPHPRP